MVNKPEILLVQLPHPSYTNRNVPLAAGYLKASAFRHGLLDAVNVTILDQDVADFGGCQRIVDEIVSRAPDVAGFSMYLWNAERVLYVIDQVRARLPELKVFVGGPEVTPTSSYILANSNIDVLVFGEGELTFVELLRHIVRSRPALHEIDGIGYRGNGTLTITKPRSRTADIGDIPSPYLLRYIDPLKYQEMMLFTMRGCTLGCSYCGWAGRGRLRAYPVERLRQELALATRARGGMTVSILDSAFNCSPVFADFCRAAQEVNSGGRLKFNCFVQADLVDAETAKLLKESNFTGVEVGLQSADAMVLASVNRSVKVADFLRGVRFLQAAELPVKVDVMLGLPGDSPASFEKTMNFIAENELDPVIFNLSLAHGARLTRQAECFGAQAQAAPPFYVLSTKTFPRPALESALAHHHAASADFDRMLNIHYPRVCRSLPLPGTSINVGRIRDLTRPIRNIVVRATKPIACDTASLSAMTEQIARHIGSDVSLHVVGDRDDVQRSVWFLRTLCGGIAQANPFITWTLHLEANQSFPTESLIEELCFFRSGKVFLDYRDELLPSELHVVRRKSLATFVHVPYDAALPLPSWRCIRTAVLGADAAEAQLEQVIRAEGCGLLIDLPQSAGIEYAHQVMARLESSGRPVYFRDWVLQRVWELEYLRSTPEGVDHSELLIDWDGSLYARHFDEGDLCWDALAHWHLLDSEPGDGDPLEIVAALATSRLLASSVAACAG